MSVEYKHDINNVYQPLSTQEQRQYYDKLMEGNYKVKEKLVYSCLPLVYDIARKFHANNKHIDILDLVQEGNIALMRAVDNWDLERSNLTTVVTHYVRNHLIDLIKESRYKIHMRHDVTKHAAEDIRKINECGTSNIDIIHEKTGLAKKRIKLLQTLTASKRMTYDLYDIDVPTVANDTGPCLADLIQLIEDNVENPHDKQIFLTWIKFINKNDKAALTAEAVDCSKSEVLNSLKRTRKFLKGLVKNA